MHTLARTAGDIRRDGDPSGRARVVVTGRLDAASGRRLALLCAQIAAQWPPGLVLDLTAISGATPDGVDAMAKCLAVGRRLPWGIDVDVASSAGRRVLLAALDGV